MKATMKRLVCVLLVMCTVLALVPAFTQGAQAAKVDDVVSYALSMNGKTASHFGFTGGWCDKFVLYCAKQASAGDAFPTYGKVGGVSNIAKWFADNSTYVSMFKSGEGSGYLSGKGASYNPNYTPKVGDVVFFRNATSKKWQHVGIVYAVSGSTVSVIHGNWSSKVQKTDFPKTGAKYDVVICGYASPAYPIMVTYSGNGGSIKIGTATAGSHTVKTNVNNNYAVPANPTRAGYTFLGWYTKINGAETKVTSSTKITYAQNHQVYAKWEANKYKVTFNANGGSVSTSSKTVTYGSAYGTLPTPKIFLLKFAGWYTAKSGGTKVTSSTVFTNTGNVTLYARWKLF